MVQLNDYFYLQQILSCFFSAPEVIDNQGYSQQCDVWSIGVIAYML